MRLVSYHGCPLYESSRVSYNRNVRYPNPAAYPITDMPSAMLASITKILWAINGEAPFWSTDVRSTSILIVNLVCITLFR